MIGIVLYEQVSAHEAFAALAAFHAADLDAELVALEALVPTREGARVVPARLGYETLGAAPAVVVPGGDVERARHDAALAKALRARAGRWLLASGEGVHLAAAAGLLEGRRVARPPGREDVAGAHVAHTRLVADGRILTCTGGDAMHDLALHYVAREHGEARARKAAERLGREYVAFAYGASETA